MPKGQRSFIAKGWNSTKLVAIHNVELPPKIRCTGCKEFKGGDMFSKIQLVDLTKSILANTESKVLCRACHAGPADEMTCSICGETKAVDGFAKAQRHDPERARCRECVNEHLTQKPGGKGYWDEPEEADSVDGTMIPNHYEIPKFSNPSWDLWGLSSGMQNLTTNNLQQPLSAVAQQAEASESAAAGGSESAFTEVRRIKGRMPARKDHADNDGWQIATGKRNWQRRNAFTAYDTQGNVCHQICVPSIIASDRNLASVAARPNKGEPRSGFARPARGSIPPPTVPAAQNFSVSRQQVSSEGGSDSDEGMFVP